MPREVDIPNPLHRQVARIFVERRGHAVVDVIEATRKFAQADLLVSSTESVPNVPFATTVAPGTSTVITPFPRTLAAGRGQDAASASAAPPDTGFSADRANPPHVPHTPAALPITTKSGPLRAHLSPRYTVPHGNLGGSAKESGRGRGQRPCRRDRADHR